MMKAASLIPFSILNTALFQSADSFQLFVPTSPFLKATQLPSFHRLTPFASKKDGDTPLVNENESSLKLTDFQLDFTIGYINKHHADFLLTLATITSPLGVTQAKRNSFSGGSYVLTSAKLKHLEYNYPTCQDEEKVDSNLTVDVNVKIRGQKEEVIETVKIPLDAQPTSRYSREYPQQPLIPRIDNLSEITSAKILPNTSAMDDLVRRLNRLANLTKHVDATGKLIQLGIQLGKGNEQKSVEGKKDNTNVANAKNYHEIKENLYLNQVPHNRYVRKYFYDLASNAILQAVLLCSQGKHVPRMKVDLSIPELNPQMDSYRIGTLLELVRDVTISLAEQNLRVRVCVQQSMGVGIFTGVPKTLSGVSQLLPRMDWQAGPGEVNEGMLGNFVNFGGVGKEHVMNKGPNGEQDDVFILICPQSMLGLECSIIGPLQEMIQAAGDRPVILINPDLSDKASAQGQQNIRGRLERIEFANSFESIFEFSNIYVSGTSYFPILGAISRPGPKMAWTAYQRRDYKDSDGGEIYVPMLSAEEKPSGEAILNTFD
jgi:adenylate kinase